MLVMTAPTEIPEQISAGQAVAPKQREQGFEHSPSEREPWLIVCGGFHEHGGMDRANLALAEYLRSAGHQVFLVGHDFDDERAAGFCKREVPRVFGSTALGERGLWHVGKRQAEQLVQRHPRARVVVNGGNCCFGDINWVHYVHNGYPARYGEAPASIRWKDQLLRSLYRRREARALRCARLVIANSETAAHQVITKIGVPSSRVRVVYLGCSPDLNPATAAERASAREWLKIRQTDRVVAFVGALTWDENKGLETLWRAWEKTSRAGRGDRVLVVAGGGAKLERWRSRIAASGLGQSVRVLGFTERVNDVLAAADVLVSPSRYETYGLNVQEAICRGVPAIVSASAGIAELYPQKMRPLLLPDCEDSGALAELIKGCLDDLENWKDCTRTFADQLRTYTWTDMAKRMVELASEENG
jgi:glycosyltransferase involved in cell wall biosynthesis